MPKTCEQEIPRNCCNILDLLSLSLRKENKDRENECSLSLCFCTKTEELLNLIMDATFQDFHHKFLEDEINTRMPLPWSQRLPCYSTLTGVAYQTPTYQVFTLKFITVAELQL